MSTTLLDRIKQESEKRKPYEKVPWWTPKAENTIRILPNLKDSEELPFITRTVHWLEKDTSANQFGFFAGCMKNLGEKCPVCEKYYSISADNQKARSKFRPANYNFYNVYDYAGGGGHGVFKIPNTLNEQIMMYATDLGGNVFDYKTGYDWKLTKTMKAGFPNYMIRPVSSPSVFKGTRDGYDLTKLFTRNDLEVLKKYLGEGTTTTESPDVEYEQEAEESPALSSAVPTGDDLDSMLKSVGIV